jgi:hypothetical protein
LFILSVVTTCDDAFCQLYTRYQNLLSINHNKYYCASARINKKTIQWLLVILLWDHVTIMLGKCIMQIDTHPALSTTIYDITITYMYKDW